MTMRSLSRFSVLATLLALAGHSWAQDPQPTVAPFPLELKRTPSGFSAKEKEELQAEFRRLVRSSGAMVPNAGAMESALLELKRQDCDRENECLQQLAQKAGTLYGVYGALDYDLAKNVVATGRVVRDDGKLMGELKTITIPKGKDAFTSVAKVALAQLLEALQVRSLKPFREVPTQPTPPVEVKPNPNDPPLPPPPTPPEPGDEHLVPRTIGYVGIGVGAAALVTGAVLLGVGHGSSGLNSENVVIDRSGYQSSQTMQQAGVGLLIAGAVVGVAGGVLVFLNPKPNVTITPAVGPSGASILVGGTF